MPARRRKECTMETTDSSIDLDLAPAASVGIYEILVSFGRRGDEPNDPHRVHFELIRPVLERLGRIREVTHPESRLAFAAHSARSRGLTPVHLAFAEPHEVYLTPTVCTAVVPLWGFEEIPDSDLCRNTRQNWARVVSRADAVLTACESAAEAFRGAGIEVPIRVMPFPVDSEFRELPTHSSDRVSIECRHLVRGGPSPSVEAIESSHAVVYPDHVTPHAAHRLFIRALPARAKRAAVRTVKRGYDRFVRRWLSQEAHDRLKGLKRAVLRRGVPVEPTQAAGPPLPTRKTLTLDGPTFLATVDYRDPGTNDIDLITAFSIAFRSRENVTLVVALETTPDREPHDLWRLLHHYELVKISHECRLVFISEPLAAESTAELMRGCRYVVDTRRSAREARAVGRALAAGRPVIAPDHSALADVVSDRTGFVVRSSPEPAAWPHHPEGRRDSLARRLDWADLRNRFLEAAALSEEAYRGLSDACRELSDEHAPKLDALVENWRSALEATSARAEGLDWVD
ncbi:MAG: hypothetical protein SFX72_07980 [Isosphaeraceae bacterium]|nr:hypothetical protein [Isosphaeraceae bacterium]